MINTLWYLCAAINVAIALLHVGVIIGGPPAYRYFGAGEWMASQDAAGSWIPALITSGITCAFFVFAAYNIAGTGQIALPLTMLALLAISTVYILRGAVVAAVPFMTTPISTFDYVSSFISLGIGLLHAVAVYFTYFAAKAA
ncbi:MAG: hypothetical protein AAFQ51_07820 [Pseudomonadota bacterium]